LIVVGILVRNNKIFNLIYIVFFCNVYLASDLQALFRSYRLGQKKVTYVYRLLSKGSMEEKIYFRQVNKQAMAQR
jgi:transcriptional regulator ATRX